MREKTATTAASLQPRVAVEQKFSTDRPGGNVEFTSVRSVNCMLYPNFRVHRYVTRIISPPGSPRTLAPGRPLRIVSTQGTIEV